MREELLQIARQCKAASHIMARTSTALKNKVLLKIAESLETNADAIYQANELDLKNARERGLSDAMVDRMVLNEKRLTGMANALREVASFDDPVGQVSEIRTRPSGIEVGMMRIPLGVIAMIYESRPNVTSDAAGLCLKAGNAVLLRGGSEAFNSNQAIIKVMHAALETVGLPPAVVSFVPSTDRDWMTDMLKLDEYIDLVIPRGGEGLIRFVAENSRIPVIKHYKGVCHLYVDAAADMDVAVNLLIDGKTSRPGVCNALETMLVHKDIAADFLPKAKAAMDAHGVELRGCTASQKILPGIAGATQDDYHAEYLALVIAVRVVDDYQQAVDHITQYGSEHTEVIATNSLVTARAFQRDVNSSVVCVNASSRFSDGGELGLGAEIGISTTKLHAFGPMGLEALTTRKFIVTGDGQTRHPV